MEDIKGFLAWLSPAERRAHELGALMLGTSYDVVKTHGYQKYLEAMKQKVETTQKQVTKPAQTTETK
jgi:fatty acid/phospholipid biosynthesis enzyme